LKPILSVNKPYNGGIIAPPTIAVHNNPDAFGFNSPKPSIAKVKIVGNIIELNKPTARMLHIDIKPVVLIEIRIKVIAKVATGLGEEVVKTVGSFLIVELMRQGKTPQEACEEAIRRIVSKPNSNYKNFQVGYIAVNKKGLTGYYAIHKGFSMTKYQEEENVNIQSNYYNKDI